MKQRRIFAEILIDEDKEEAVCKEKGTADTGTLDYLQQEFGWMEQSGASLNRAMVADEDDCSYYARYLGYLMDWALEQPTDHYEGKEPLTYRQWIKEKDTKPAELKKKLVLMSPTVAAVSLIHSLDTGELNQNGDRTTEYVNIATVMSRNKYVKVSLIEELHDLPEHDRGYAVHIINDIDGTDCKTFRTETLNDDELENLFARILDDLQEGRL